MANRYISSKQLKRHRWGISRRDFLRWVSGGLVIAAMPPLTGCGGGGGGGSSSGNPPPGEIGVTAGTGTKGSPISAAQRLMALNSVEAEFERQVSGGGHFDPAAMVAFLQQQSAFHEVGYSAASGCAWAVFTDGRKLMVIDNLDASQSPAAATGVNIRPVRAAASTMVRALTPDPLASADDTEPLITAAQFRLINMWENAELWKVQPVIDYLHVTDNWVDADTLPRIGRIARGLGFDLVDPGLVIDSGPERSLIGDVEGLKNVSGDGVFFLTGSAGFMTTTDGAVQGICTTTLSSSGGTLIEAYETDLDAGSLIYAVALDHLSPGAHTYFAITPQFIRAYKWSFPTESLVFLNVTGGGISDWLDPLYEANAGVVMGWTETPDQRSMLGVAQDLFELLFATNHINPQWHDLSTEPRLRSYGLVETQSYLAQKLMTFPDNGESGVNHLEIVPASSDLFINQLRPSIEYIAVSEIAGEVMIQGQFGKTGMYDYEAKVLIGSETKEIMDPDPRVNAPVPELAMVADRPLVDISEEMPIIEWLPSFIRLDGVDPSKSDSGMIQVWQGKRYSNIAHLTLWPIRFQLNRTVGGALLRSVTLDINIRAFVSGYRLRPDQPLDQQLPMVSITSMAKGGVGWSASGSVSKTESGTTTTVAWSGSGNFSVIEPPQQIFMLNGILWFDKKQLDCTLEMNVPNALHVTTSTQAGVLSEEDVEFKVSTPVVGVVNPASPVVGTLSLSFDENWNLLAGEAIYPDNNEDVLGYNNCETQFKWGAVTPQFPPEMARGGR
jgi:hypothetical protein